MSWKRRWAGWNRGMVRYQKPDGSFGYRSRDGKEGPTGALIACGLFVLLGGIVISAEAEVYGVFLCLVSLWFFWQAFDQSAGSNRGTVGRGGSAARQAMTISTRINAAMARGDMAEVTRLQNLAEQQANQRLP